jgi:hypothetical protein
MKTNLKEKKCAVGTTTACPRFPRAQMGSGVPWPSFHLLRYANSASLCGQFVFVGFELFVVQSLGLTISKFSRSPLGDDFSGFPGYFRVFRGHAPRLHLRELSQSQYNKMAPATLDLGHWSLDNSPVAKCSQRKAHVGSCRLKKIPRSCRLFSTSYPLVDYAPPRGCSFQSHALIKPLLTNDESPAIKVIQDFQRQHKVPQKAVIQGMISMFQPCSPWPPKASHFPLSNQATLTILSP